MELPLGRTGDQEESERRLDVNKQVARIVIETAVEQVNTTGDLLLENQIEIFRRGAAGEPLVEMPADVDPTTIPDRTSGPISGTPPMSRAPSSPGRT